MFTLLTLFACYWQDKYYNFYKATTMLTKKGKYGLKALVDLARLAPGETAFINDIAARNNIPKKFLDTILLELRNVGILRSKKGPGGGYSLSRPATEIRIGHGAVALGRAAEAVRSLVIGKIGFGLGDASADTVHG